jgi:hypothetical protein
VSGGDALIIFDDGILGRRAADSCSGSYTSVFFGKFEVFETPLAGGIAAELVIKALGKA